jgi:hypothetical protein
MELVSVESARKWLGLAERRRSYFVELYRSGRWARYYDESSLKKHMIEVIADVERWQKVIETFHYSENLAPAS